MFHLTSPHGHPLDQLKSGLQKYIRRGDGKMAHYCLEELLRVASESEAVATNVARRLRVIYLEDVSCGGNLDWWEKFESLTDHQKVQMMVDAPKARTPSHLRAYASSITEEEWRDEEVFEEALEAFDPRVAEYARLLAESPNKNGKRRIAYVIKTCGGPYEDVAMEWYRNKYISPHSNDEAFLYLVPLVARLQCQIPHSQSDALCKPPRVSYKHPAKKLDLASFVRDRHTRAGAGSSLATFATEGAFVNNESPRVNPIWKKAYNVAKGVEDDDNTYVSESDLFELVVRAQLTCSKSRPDVYFAIYNSKLLPRSGSMGLVLVKGPCTVDYPMRALQWKQEHGIRFVHCEKVWCIPDRWPEGVPIGIRNKVDRDEPALFLVYDSLIEEPIATKIHSSKLWPPTEVAVPLVEHLSDKHFTLHGKSLWDEYIEALLVRKRFGIGDLADRNFLVVDGHLYSIDEEGESTKPVNFVTNLTKKRLAEIQKRCPGEFE